MKLSRLCPQMTPIIAGWVRQAYQLRKGVNNMEQTQGASVPTPPLPTALNPTLIETLNGKLHVAHEELDQAEQRVKDIEAEIARVPVWAKDLTAEELQAKVEGWFK